MLFSTLKEFLKHQISMNYKRSCDIEHWSNDAENSALHHRNKLHFKIYEYRK